MQMKRSKELPRLSVRLEHAHPVVEVPRIPMLAYFVIGFDARAIDECALKS